MLYIGIVRYKTCVDVAKTSNIIKLVVINSVVHLELRINPFNRGNPMGFKDAAIVATITAFVIWILEFLAAASVGQLRADPEAFVFAAIQSYAVKWAGVFLTLAGLEQYIKRKEKTDHE